MNKPHTIRLIVTSLVLFAFIGSNLSVEGQGEGQVCHDKMELVYNCPHQEPTPSGGCVSGAMGEQMPETVADTTNVSSTRPHCKRILGSLCEGYNFGGNPCGSLCATVDWNTGSRAIGYGEDTVQADSYIAEFWCADYEEIIGNMSFQRACAPLCLNGQQNGSTSFIVSNCRLTGEGCLPGEYE